MSIIKHNKNNNTQQDNSSITLTKDEIIWILNLIKDSTFQGKDVQTVYEIAVKLQIKLNQL